MSNKNYERLSDKVLEALKLALEQKDAAIADLLGKVLELAMTRSAGGKDFVERREFTSEVESALSRLSTLRQSARG